MNKLIKQSEVISFFNKSELDILCIVETRVRKNKAPTLHRKKFKQFYILDNYSSHLNGRLWVIWRNSAITIQCQHSSSQWMHLLVSYGPHTMEVTCVYGFNHPAQRIPLWDFLSSRSGSSLPWLILGDMNCVRNSDERISSDPPNIAAMDEFNLAINNAGLEELKTQGCWYTWTNKQEHADRKWMRLDRGLANVPWFLAFPDAYVEALTPGISDHSPLVISLGGSNPHRKMVQHLRKIKYQLKHLHKASYTSITERVSQVHQQLHLCRGEAWWIP
ncbi:uncharacterized protein LOC141600868 [Silene latifolia]|uniref:uncharacterized protein LOC141600868 n=1 Tax=Silene latifolia TaxID=37657 RepID=UPI003D76FF23